VKEGRVRNTAKLKQIMARRAATIAPGAANAFFARIIEDLGFECVYVTGAGIANMQLGLPDMGLTSLGDVVSAVSSISQAVSLPLIVDADTGFGNALNVYRTVGELQRAGAAAIQIEDQVFPKKCGHFAGKEVVAQAEMIQKIKAALDARSDPDLQIIARTDAIAVEGLDRAIERAHAFAEAGADAIFVEAPTNVADMARIAKEIGLPQVVNVVFGGKTPEVSHKLLAEMGCSIVLYANAALQASLKASQEVLGVLREKRSLASVSDRLSSFDERQRVVAKGLWDDREALYRVAD
jgi:2-methylisocitrate lyase-like PEP mutase family enzyme